MVGIISKLGFSLLEDEARWMKPLMTQWGHYVFSVCVESQRPFFRWWATCGLDVSNTQITSFCRHEWPQPEIHIIFWNVIPCPFTCDIGPLFGVFRPGSFFVHFAMIYWLQRCRKTELFPWVLSLFLEFWVFSLSLEVNLWKNLAIWEFLA